MNKHKGKVSETYTKGLISNISDEEYYSDRRLSYSLLRDYLEHPTIVYDRLHEEQEPTKAMLLGRIFHEKTLEPDVFTRKYVPPPLGEDGKYLRANSKAYKDKELQAYQNQKEMLTATQMTELKKIDKNTAWGKHIDKYLNPPEDVQYINELAVFWNRQGKKFKSKIDKIIIDREQRTIRIIDLKTSQSSGKSAFTRTIKAMHYDMQMALYVGAVMNIIFHNNDVKVPEEWIKITEGLTYEELSGYRFECLIIAISKSGIFVPNVFVLSENLLQDGANKADTAVTLDEECQKSKTYLHPTEEYPLQPINL